MHVGIALLLAVVGSAAIPASHAANAAEATWEEALAPLRTMPVQDYGFVRSGVTFGENHLLAITGKRSLEGRSALDAVLFLMADPTSAAQTPLFKVTHPDLGALYGSKIISPEQLSDPLLQEQLTRLIRSNPHLEKPVGEMMMSRKRLETLEEDFAIIPRGPTLSGDDSEWLSPPRAALLLAESAEDAFGLSPQDIAILDAWNALKHAIHSDDVGAGARAAQGLARSVLEAAEQTGAALPKLRLDALYHAYQPFAKAAFLYLLGTLGFLGTLVFRREWFARAGYAALSVGFLAQAAGTIARWVLSGRAPLANMYESFTFAVGGMVLVALVFEATHKMHLAGFGAGLLGFLLMVLAHKAPIFHSEIRPLMPALQSSWLTYHVVTIMLSYSAFLLSFFLAVCYLVKDALGGDNARLGLVRALPSLESLDELNYRVIGVGFPLLTIGIVLGAVWAATAWGRPWGFDPKETWSAITWLIYAAYLHARYLAGWRGRRAAILALIGFACVLFTYLGVNYLLPGLHSYT